MVNREEEMDKQTDTFKNPEVLMCAHAGLQREKKMKQKQNVNLPSVILRPLFLVMLHGAVLVKPSLEGTT